MTYGDAANEEGIITKLSPRTVPGTVAHLTDMLTARGIKVFAVIDQGAEAQEAGLDLRDTVLVIFGNPAAGTLVMDAKPLAALDLPLKLLIWDDAGQTRVSYYPAATLAARYGLGTDLASKLGVVDPLTDALIAQ